MGKILEDKYSGKAYSISDHIQDNIKKPLGDIIKSTKILRKAFKFKQDQATVQKIENEYNKIIGLLNRLQNRADLD